MYCLKCHEPIWTKRNFANLFHINNRYFCQACLNKLHQVTKGCKYCGQATNVLVCDDCQHWEAIGLPIYHKSLYYYNDFARELINEIKFSGNLRILHAFKQEIRQKFKLFYDKTLKVIPVPLHQHKLIIRGFNQSMEIAKVLPNNILDCLEKNNDITQSKRKKAERITSDNDFSFKDESINLAGERVVILDDIYTTGSTIHQIGALLFSKGVKEINSFTLFRS